MKRQEMVFDPFQLLGKKDRKQLTRRNDWIGLSYLGTHLGAIGVSGTGIYLTAGTLFMIPMMFVHGILLACLFAPMHECSHGTAFRTRRLNEAVYWFVSLIYIIQPTWYRYRHAVHHTYTQIQGMDPAMVLPSPTTWRHYCEQLLGWRLWTTFPVVITKHALGRMRPQDSWYVPKQDLPRIYGEARVMLVVYGAVAGLAVFFGSFAPLIYWIIPRILGEPLQRAWRIAEHKGCDEGPDVRTNTRSTRTGASCADCAGTCRTIRSTTSVRKCLFLLFLPSIVSSEISSSRWARASGPSTRRSAAPASSRRTKPGVILEERRRKKESVDEVGFVGLIEPSRGGRPEYGRRRRGGHGTSPGSPPSLRTKMSSSSLDRRACNRGLSGQRAVLCHPGSRAPTNMRISPTASLSTASSSALSIKAASIFALEKRSAPRSSSHSKHFR